MPIFEVDESNFNEIKAEELSKGNSIILTFGSELCDACQALEYEVEEIVEKNDDISILSLDINDATVLTEKYGVEQIPTIIIYNSKDQMLHRHDGLMLCQDIEKIIKK
ncbi:MAG: thioredoxin family protein [Campylobacterota bacterium]|nr:thioredoxin family protein [Campylobacterota bacterium]